MKCECSLKEFVKKYPNFRWQFSNLLSDPNYMVKFQLNRKNEFVCIEVGYKDDLWACDKMPDN